MCRRISTATAALVTALMMTVGAVQALADAKYPDWTGGWRRWAPPNAVREAGNGGLNLTAGGQPSFDQTKPWGLGQEAPLTPEYEKIFAASMADQANGGQGNFFNHAVRCMPAGMPMMTIAFFPLEFVITPGTTYVLIGGSDQYRRIFTDGDDWPKNLQPTYAGYSIGRWIDEDGDGTYDVLEIETRGPFKGPRAYDATGLPLAFDNQSVFKERIHLDRADPSILHDEMTVIDHALTRPWTVDKRYVRNPNPRPLWPEYYCGEHNAQVTIGKENYFLGADGELMPTRNDQPPPDLRHFKQTQK